MIDTLTIISELLQLIHNVLDLIIHRLDNPSGDLEADLHFIWLTIRRINNHAIDILILFNNLGLRTLPDIFRIIIDGFDVMGRAVYLNDGTIYTPDFIDLVRRLLSCIGRLEIIINRAIDQGSLPNPQTTNPFGRWIANTIFTAIGLCIAYLRAVV